MANSGLRRTVFREFGCQAKDRFSGFTIAGSERQRDFRAFPTALDLRYMFRSTQAKLILVVPAWILAVFVFEVPVEIEPQWKIASVKCRELKVKNIGMLNFKMSGSRKIWKRETSFFAGPVFSEDIFRLFLELY